MATAVPAPVSTVSPAVRLSADSTALIVGGTTCPTPDADVEVIMNQFITPTHPGQTITPVAVTAPGEVWPDHRDFAPCRARGRGSELLRTWWRSVAG